MDQILTKYYNITINSTNNYTTSLVISIEQYPFNATILTRGYVMENDTLSLSKYQHKDYDIAIQNENDHLLINETNDTKTSQYANIDISMVNGSLQLNITGINQTVDMGWMIIQNNN